MPGAFLNCRAAVSLRGWNRDLWRVAALAGIAPAATIAAAQNESRIFIDVFLRNENALAERKR